MKKAILEKDFHSFTKSLNTSQQSLCFIDSVIHFKKVQQIQEISQIDILFLINNQDLIKEINNANYEFIYFKNKLSLINVIFGLRDQKFNYYFAACIDQLYFQLIYFLCSFSFLATIDEGIFSVDKFSRFNSEKHFKYQSHRLYFFLEKFFGFPKVPNFFLESAQFHFGWFNKSLYKNTILRDKLILMESNVNREHKQLKVFIGQPFKWMGLASNDENYILRFIKEECIDIYLQHPRETKENSIILDVNCPIVSTDTNAESFLSMLNNKNLSVYSFMSSVLFGVNSEIDINILSLPLSGELLKRHNSFLEMLNQSEIKYTLN